MLLNFSIRSPGGVVKRVDSACAQPKSRTKVKGQAFQYRMHQQQHQCISFHCRRELRQERLRYNLFVTQRCWQLYSEVRNTSQDRRFANGTFCDQLFHAVRTKTKFPCRLKSVFAPAVSFSMPRHASVSYTNVLSQVKWTLRTTWHVL